MAARIVRSDSAECRRIVQAFVEFLNSVEAGADDDLEGVQVAVDCLTQVFRLHQLPHSLRPPPNLLLHTFADRRQQQQTTVQNDSQQQQQQQPQQQQQQQDNTQTHHTSVPLSKDELFGHFFGALEKIQFFSRTTPNGDDDPVLLDRATSMFHRALNEIETSASQFDLNSLANALKTLGNKAMQSELYPEACEWYTCAIALSENNAVFYCNRAAAYTQLKKYSEAVADSLKSIEIDPLYSKAYSRLGLAYYAQGNYSDAINKGFRKALELDPTNASAKENIRVAEQKMVEEQEQRNQYQDSRFHFAGGSGNQAGQQSFPLNLANLFGTLSGTASQNQNGQSRAAEDNHRTHTSFTSHTFDGNSIPVDIANIPENIASTIMNATRAFQGPASESRSAEQTPENETFNPFSSIPSDAGSLPSDLAEMFMNMNGQETQGQRGQQRQEDGHVGGSDEPGIGMGANFSFNISGSTEEELNRSLRSALRMFSGGNGDSQSNVDGRPNPSV